ncbi:MAG: hypothetical protein AB7J19_16760, partial [Beijerinckiaceae bacterium]
MSESRILTTHVGSLVRPPKLAGFLRAAEDGEKIEQGAFQACLSESIAEVVSQQKDAGVDIVSDGEFGKFHSWSRYIIDRLAGFEVKTDESASGLKKGEVISAGHDRRLFPEFYAEYDKSQG